jgi:membrane protease subunit HflC
MNFDRGGIAAITVLAAAIGSSTVFTVHQTEQVLIIRLGEPLRTITEPGLNFKMPLIDNVISIEKRVLDLEVAPQEIIASDQKRLIITSFARYRILDALKFYQTLGSVSEAESRLSIMLISALRRVLGESSFIQILRTERSHLTSSTRDQLDSEAGSLGISIVDVRIRGANLPEQNSLAIYNRMQTERQREATMYRAEGSQRSQEIRAMADRDATVLVAKATSNSEQIRGDGDVARNRIFADAFGKDPDFAAFCRSMQAYDTALLHDSTRMLLWTNSEFFRYIVDPLGQETTAGPMIGHY